MRRDDLLQILTDWNFWGRTPETGIARPRYLAQFDRFEKTGHVVVVTGVRRSGKSTLMKQFIHERIRAGHSPNNFLYLNLEEPRLIGHLDVAFLTRVYETYAEELAPTEKPLILLDEIQNVPGWERFVRGLHERNEATIVLSGSSSKVLSRELGSLLTGRHLDLVVYPLDFTEYLSFHNLSIHSLLEEASQRRKIRKLLQSYLASGGFPQVVQSSERSLVLIHYLEDILTRDIVVRHHITETERLRSLAKFVLTNVGSLASYRSLRSVTQLSLQSIERFLGFFREAYLTLPVTKFAWSLKEQEVSSKKLYAIDNGLRNTVSFRFSDDLGKLFENTVCLHLQMAAGETYYFRGKRECDFILKQQNRVLGAIQVCFDLNASNRTRELEGLLEAMDALGLKQGLILTADEESEETVRRKKIHILPLWKWLIHKDLGGPQQGFMGSSTRRRIRRKNTP